jgi:predicted metal-binding membrane protein
MSSASLEAASMMAMGMRPEAPWAVPDILFTFIMWVVMMVGMMSASAAPVLLLFAKAQQARSGPAGSGNRAVPFAVPAFALGYLAVWVGFSVVATLAQWALHDAALLSPAMAIARPRVAALVLIAAGAYQLTPLKRACLRHCQSPMGFLMSHWREGTGGGFQMGLNHGTYCLGCCWVLMCVLFAVGVMNLLWVATLTLFILIERQGAGGGRVSQIGGAALIGLGCVALARTI